ncbi:MAG: thiamine-phosphate kinase [Pontibacterium sp.]
MSTATLSEFELIRHFFASSAKDASVALGIGDDCALLVPAAGEVLAVSIDTLVEGTHFLPGTAPAHLATRLLGAAVSDLAAMGAKPAWFTLALTLPEADPEWLAPFAASLAESAAELSIHLVGGDTTRGPLSLSAQVHGFVPVDKALTRTGASVGDLVCVTGCLGDSRAGLESLLKEQPEDHTIEYLRQRFYAPQPRIQTGIALRMLASACLDISDGLLADLGHLLVPSGLGADINPDNLPLSAALLAYVDKPQARQWALTGGEDFELCFTLPPEKRHLLNNLPDPVSVLGVITEQPGIRIAGQAAPDNLGFDHFSEHSS